MENLNNTEVQSQTAFAILQALEENNTEVVIKVLKNYLKTKNKEKLVKRNSIVRSTLYLNLSKKANPTLKTLAKLVHACTTEHRRESL
jgi:DNA-binding phage protein